MNSLPINKMTNEEIYNEMTYLSALMGRILKGNNLKERNKWVPKVTELNHAYN